MNTKTTETEETPDQIEARINAEMEAAEAFLNERFTKCGKSKFCDAPAWFIFGGEMERGPGVYLVDVEDSGMFCVEFRAEDYASPIEYLKAGEVREWVISQASKFRA